jgi:hypothetical protein
VNLAGSSSTAIDWSVITAFSQLGVTRQKIVHFIRPLFNTDGFYPDVAVEPKYDFSLTEVNGEPQSAGSTGDLWDEAKWDEAAWGELLQNPSRTFGGGNMGVSVAIAAKGSSLNEGTLIGFDVTYAVGGIL